MGGYRCWPTAADDTISLFWSLVRCHCLHSLWWGGIPFQSLCDDPQRGTTLQLPMQEEASLLAYAQVSATPRQRIILNRSVALDAVHCLSMSPIVSFTGREETARAVPDGGGIHSR